MESNPGKRPNLWVIIPIALIAVIIVTAIIFPFLFRARRAAQRGDVFNYTREVGMPAYDAGSPAQEGSTVAWSTVHAASTPRMVISTASLSLRVEDTEKAHKEISDIAFKVGGFITSSSLDRYDKEVAASITLRVPAKEYSPTLSAIRGLGTVLSREESGEDVTEQYVDLQSRIRNLQREETALLKVLDRSGKIPDILAVEKELSRVRGEIEQAQGRSKYLQDQVAFSTINVRLSELSPSVAATVVWDIGRTATGAANALQVVFRGIASLVVWAVVFIPLWALLGISIYGYRRYSRRRIGAD